MIELKDNIFWVGVRDWELKRFHGEELSTHRGSTYNAYLIRDEKTVLIDTVWSPFKESWLDWLDEQVNLQTLDYVVINHSEEDHAGCLPALMEKVPHLPIYCSPHGTAAIEDHFHPESWDIRKVRTGDTLDLGRYQLQFVEMPMLHWPDSMATFVTNANILFSNDAFGQHYATSFLYNDQVDQAELYQEALKYYANILTPFSAQVKRKLNEIKQLNLPIEIIAPSHGVVWRDNPLQIVEQYNLWANDYQEKAVLILYDTMWGATRKAAEAIAAGVESQGIATKLMHVGKADQSDIITEIFKARGLIFGSPTVNDGIMSAAAGLLESIRGMRFRNKQAFAFGSYGWSGGSAGIIEQRLTEAGFEIVLEPLKWRYVPTSEVLQKAKILGTTFGEKIKE